MIRAYKFVPFRSVEDHMRLGWMIAFPSKVSHHHYYSVVLQWICDCQIPGTAQ